MVFTSSQSAPVAQTHKHHNHNKSQSSVIIPPNADKVDLTIPSTIAKARIHVDYSDNESDSTIGSDQSSIAPDFAFAFDIDGVLLKGGEVIPEAREALRVLNGDNEEGIKVPYIFVTNGGGKTEEERCVDLSKQLQLPVSPQQFICGHTPMREMAKKHKTVLVVGGEGEKCRVVAESYGFQDVVTPGDLIKWNPACCPFRKLTDEEYKNSRTRDFTNVAIEAIFVFADSRDWAGDAQIILELLRSKGGVMGTESETFDEGPTLYFSHNDMVWSTNYTLNRYGMGALRFMIESLFRETTGKELTTVAFGKPQKGTFDYATRVLEQWRSDVFDEASPPKTIYFVGDTPESDIRGTNEYDAHSKAEWHSILVETGVWNSGTEPRYKPKATVRNVLEAVKYGIRRSSVS